VRPQRARNVAFAGFLACFGVRPIVINLMIQDPALAKGAVLAATLLDVVSAVLLACAGQGWSRSWPPSAVRVWRWGLAATVLLAVASAALLWPARFALQAGVGFAATATGVLPFEQAGLGAMLNVAAALVVAGLESARAQGARMAAAPVWVGAGLAVYGAFDVGEYMLSLGITRQVGIGYVLSECLVLVAVLAALRFAGTAARRPAWLFAAAVLASFGLGMLKTAAIGNFDFVGSTGLARAVGFLLVAYAVFRLGLLGVGLDTISFRVGALASLGLAALFITAQLAQNFLSDKLGLALGGIVAGAVVFAAFPLQRAAERVMERQRTPASAPLQQYRTQVELAWRDGRLGANERLMLAEFRRQLGLGLVDAERIDSEVATQHVTPKRRPRRTQRPG
jgi:hypothetical protein